jgi:hypothetical protein
MIKIINEIDGKKYELVPEENTRQNSCGGCAFYPTQRKCALSQSHRNWDKNNISVCEALHGIWKEVRDGEPAM